MRPFHLTQSESAGLAWQQAGPTLYVGEDSTTWIAWEQEMAERRDFIVVMSDTSPEVLTREANTEIEKWQRLEPPAVVVSVQYSLAYPPDINALKQGPATHGALIHFRAIAAPDDRQG
jgi:hypothetical protein